MRLLLTWNALAEDVDMIREATGAEVVLARDKEEAVRLAPTADVIFGLAAAEVLKAAEKCRWLQIIFAGAERVLAAEWGNPDMVVTNASGIFGPPVAEHAVGLLLALNRGIHLSRDNQLARVWESNINWQFRELTSVVVGILGFGNLGEQVAKRLAGFGCEIIGFRRNPTGEERYAKAVYPIAEFDNYLGQLDYLIGTLPETADTIGFLHRGRLQKMQSHAMIINVGRGSLIPHGDLVEALEKGWIGGVGLDVTNPEPLSAESPLWEMTNVLITPHNAGYTPFHKTRAISIFLENWGYFQKEGIPRINVVNPKLGY
jgi:phosphoglycerate dehydrogenase-like enzyme